MVVTLKYGDEEWKDAVNALKVNSWTNTVWELDQWLRSEYKHNDKRDEKESDAFYECREKLREILAENGLNMDDI